MATSSTNGLVNTQQQPSEDVPEWKRKARAHRAHQYTLIPPEWRLDPSSIPSPEKLPNAIPFVEQHLSQVELEITNEANVNIILHNIVSRKWTSLNVTRAFCHRAALLHQLTGCLTEILFSSALERAIELDTYLEATGKPIGALHGLPLSIKDNHDIEGVDSTVGWVGLIGKPAKKDHPAVSMYRKLGAVFYVKTNVPQSMMMSDSYNHVWGQSVNSLNRRLISGGSSGGEAALVAGGGSVVGIGTDIGGSVRIPAALQGLYGLCPTIGRVGNRESIRRDKYIVPPVAGPLTRSLDTLEEFMKAYASGEPWNEDPGILPIPWRQELAKEVVDSGRKLRIGYIIDDGVVLPQPPAQRAVREVVAKFKKAGHEVIEWDPSSHKIAYDLWLKAVLADGGQRCADMCKLSGQPLIQGMLVGRPEDALNSTQKMELSDEIFDFQQNYMSRWNEAGLDALIMPTIQYVGLKPKMWVQGDIWVGYTSIWNLMNWTSLSIPATKVNKKLDTPEESWLSHQSRSFSDQFNHDGYDVELLDGMPVGVQVVTGRFGEEKAVGIAKVIESLST